MPRYEVFSYKKSDDYKLVELGHFKVYVPAPKDNEKLPPKLVISVLERIAQDCGVEGAKVRRGSIVMQRKGGRAHACAITGTPSEKEVIRALVSLGYVGREKGF